MATFFGESGGEEICEMGCSTAFVQIINKCHFLFCFVFFLKGSSSHYVKICFCAGSLANDSQVNISQATGKLT